MGSKCLEGRYLLHAPIEESFHLVQKALNEMGLKKLKMKKEVPPNYLLAGYSSGWLEKSDVEFTFKKRQNASEVSVKWFYPFSSESEMRAFTKDKSFIHLATVQGEERRYQAERLFEELRNRIGATDIPVEEEKTYREKEIVREKEIIVKIRCPYCSKLYDETLDTCPHCGGHR